VRFLSHDAEFQDTVGNPTLPIPAAGRQFPWAFHM